MDAAKELDGLRKADDDLSGQITTISFVRLGLLITVAILVARALINTNVGEIARSVRLVEKNRDAAHALSQPLDPLSFLLGSPSWRDQQGQPVHDEALRTSVKELRGQYDAAFNFTVSALGTNLPMDLRVLILSLPFWLPLLHIYLSALRGKRLVLRASAHAALRAAPEDSQLLDRLIFGAEPSAPLPFRVFPTNLVMYVSRLVLVVLAVLTMTLAWPYLTGDLDSNYTLFFVWCSVAMTIFGLAGAMAVRARIFGGVPGSAAEDYLQSPLERCWRWAGKWAGRGLMALNPRRWVTVGGLLLLLTLVLATGESGCADQRPGYEVLAGKAYLAGANNLFDQFAGRIVYALAILTALGSLAAGWRGVAPRVGRLLTGASVSLTYFAWVYLTSSAAPYVWVIPWLLATLLWCWYNFGDEKHRRHWPLVRTVVTVGYLPIALLSLVYYGFAIVFRFLGVPVFLLSVQILACGYLGWAAQDKSGLTGSLKETAASPH